jgi:drug/metabolite transporter (DMT)-like permease
MVCAALSATLMFATVKALGGRVDSFQIVFFRALAGTLVAIPMLMRSGGRGFRSAHMHFQVGNGVLGVVAMTSTYFALEHMALADATAVLFARPLFLLLLAMLFLGEAMQVGRWLATFVGFLGVLVIVKPAGIIEVAALAIVFSALVSAVMIVLSKKMVAADGPDIQLFYFNLTMGAVLIVPTAVFWVTPSWNDFGLLLLVGVFGTTNALFIVQALRVGEATAVSPFDYTRLLFAALFGFVLFSEVPDAWFWVGSAMIVVANVYIARNRS